MFVYNMAKFLFILNYCLAVANGLGIVDSVVAPTDQGVMTAEDIRDTYGDVNDAPNDETLSGDVNFLVENVRTALNAISLFISAFQNAVLVKPTLNAFTCSWLQCGQSVDQLYTGIQLLCMLVYSGGLMQLLAGRYFSNID